MPRSLRTLFALVLLLLIPTRPAAAYSVLSHEEVVDMAWKDNIVPLLKARFPGLDDDAIRQAHAYAYGGSIIQDIGYYPFGSKYFSDLLHYVRTGDFVETLIKDSTTPNEYAFALGALAHFCGDTIGHPFINKVTADEYPQLKRRFGQSVTYYEDPTAHLRTEFGFDVVEVAHGRYSQDNYRDFIGFQVAKPLLEQAFQETYGFKLTDIMKHEDLAISTYRKAVSSIVPEMTRVALVNYKKQIAAENPSFDEKKFLYRLNQTEYQKEYGTDYVKPGFGARFTAVLIRFMPKIGPFKALHLKIPTPDQQTLYIKGINSTVDQFKIYLSQIHAHPMPIPPPDPKDVADAQKAADKADKAADKAQASAEKASDPKDKAAKEQKATAIQHSAERQQKSADSIAAKAAPEATNLSKDSVAKDAPRPSNPHPPVVPDLRETDMDTGKPTADGEYALADQTYAHLLADLVKPDAPPVPAELKHDILEFYKNPVAPDDLKKKPEDWQKVQANLTALRSQPAASPPPTGTR